MGREILIKTHTIIVSISYSVRYALVALVNEARFFQAPSEPKTKNPAQSFSKLFPHSDGLSALL